MTITGLHTNNIELTDKIAEAMTTALTNSTNSDIDFVKERAVFVQYGEVPEVEENEIQDEIVTAYVGVFDLDMFGKESETSGQVVKEGRLFLNVFATYARRAIEFSEILLKEFGYVTEEGALGMPAYAPWEIGNLSVLKFDPVGGFNFQAIIFGKIFVNRQLINFALYDKDISDS